MCKNKSWDEILAYPTVKIVKVNDKRLGGTRYFLLFAICAYIIGYIIIWQKRYNYCITPDGSIELSLQKPNKWIDPSNYTYCASNSNPSAAIILPCAVADGSDVYQPVDQTDAMFIATRFSEKYQERNPNCTIGQRCLTPWIDSPHNSTNKTYSAGIESFTIRFSHFFQARQFYLEKRDLYYSKSCAEMKGTLENSNSDVIATYGNNGSDIIPLGTILSAADVHLDDPSEYAPNIANNETQRYAGIVLFFGIDYNGVYKKEITYTYTVTQVPGVEYKVKRKTMVNSNGRLITNTHGVKIFFLFSGNICRFDFQTMLINLVAGIGLLSIATLTTDFVMLYVMPLKDIYAGYKYNNTRNANVLKEEALQQYMGDLVRLDMQQSTSIQ